MRRAAALIVTVAAVFAMAGCGTATPTPPGTRVAWCGVVPIA